MKNKLRKIQHRAMELQLAANKELNGMILEADIPNCSAKVEVGIFRVPMAIMPAGSRIMETELGFYNLYPEPENNRVCLYSVNRATDR